MTLSSASIKPPSLRALNVFNGMVPLNSDLRVVHGASQQSPSLDELLARLRAQKDGERWPRWQRNLTAERNNTVGNVELLNIHNLHCKITERSRGERPEMRNQGAKAHHILDIAICHMAFLNVHQQPPRGANNHVHCSVQNILLGFHPCPSSDHCCSKACMMTD